MNSFKILAISLLMVSASAIVASQDPVAPSNGIGTTLKGYASDLKACTFDKVIIEANSGWKGAALVGAGVAVAAYGLTKLSKTAKTGWNMARLNVVSDKIESTVERAKNNPKSVEGAIVGTASLALVYAGLVKLNVVNSPFATSAVVIK